MSGFYHRHCDWDYEHHAKVYGRCDIRAGKPCIPCTESVQMEANIEEAEANLEKMITQHRQMRTVVNQAHDPILRRVPPEIASLIFQFACPNTWPTSLERRLSYNVRISEDQNALSSPLILGAVCRAWRELIWATPRLWSTIHLTSAVCENSSALYKIPQTKLCIFKEWLSRSGNLPLSVYIHGYITDGYDYDEYEWQDNPEENFLSFLDILTNYSYRLQDLAIVCPSSFISEFNGRSGDAPLLRRLVLENTEEDWPSDDPQVQFNLGDGILRPSFISLDGYLTRYGAVDWNYLTTLIAQCLPAEECFNMLRAATKLTFCRFEHIKWGSGNSPHMPVIQGTLESVEFIVNRWFDTFVEFIERLTLPALKHLTIREFGDEVPYDCLSALMTRSSCALNTLHIYNVSTCEPFGELITLLQAQPSIEILSLYPEYNNYHHELLRLLSHTSTAFDEPDHQRHFNIFLPNLRSLSLRAPYQSVSAEGPYQFPNKFWNLVSNIFGPLPERRRLLDTLKINASFQDDDDKHRPSFLDKNVSKAVLQRFIDAHDAGVSLVLPCQMSREELVRMWLQSEDFTDNSDNSNGINNSGGSDDSDDLEDLDDSDEEEE